MCSQLKPLGPSSALHRIAGLGDKRRAREQEEEHALLQLQESYERAKWNWAGTGLVVGVALGYTLAQRKLM